MSRIAYVNGRYVSLRTAAIPVEDRGLQLGDAVYEVIYVAHARIMDAGPHLARLRRSLAALRIAAPLHETALHAVLKETIRRNRLITGLLYIQISRGTAPRAHPFPGSGVQPNIIITGRRVPACPADAEGWGITAITLPDERWRRCDIKTTNLLPNVLARQAAREQGAAEAILFDSDGFVTEGAATTVWMVGQDGVLRTHHLDRAVLPGCTRDVLLHMFATEGGAPAVLEERCTVTALRAAREIFLTSATSFVKPVLCLDGVPVGDGLPGPVASFWLARLAAHFEKQAS